VARSGVDIPGVGIDGWHELGPVTGGCRRCGTPGRLFLGEFRSRPALRERLRGGRRETTSRLVSCLSCGWRWTVRLTETCPRRAATTGSS